MAWNGCVSTANASTEIPDTITSLGLSWIFAEQRFVWGPCRKL